MFEHLNETELERLLVTADDLSADEKERLESHLDRCSLCREHLLRLREFHSGVKAELENPPTQRDQEMAEAILSSGRKALPSEALQRQPETVLDAYAEVIEPYKRPLVQRVIRFARVHPVQFAGVSSLALAALVALVLILRPSAAKDLNPSYHRIRGQVLYIFNKSGEVLWTKPADGFRDDSTEYSPTLCRAHEFPVEVLHVDGDSENECSFMESRTQPFLMTRSIALMVTVRCDGNTGWEKELDSERLMCPNSPIGKYGDRLPSVAQPGQELNFSCGVASLLIGLRSWLNWIP